jgi:hypothetical protein
LTDETITTVQVATTTLDFDVETCSVQSIADVDNWELDSTTFAVIDFDDGLGALRLRGGFFTGTSHATCDIDTRPVFGFYHVRATVLARSLEEQCTLEVSTDLGATWTLAMLDEDDDGPADAAYDGLAVSQVVELVAAEDIELRLTLSDADWWDFCYLTNVTVEPLTEAPVDAEDLTVPKQLYFSDFSDPSSSTVAGWSSGSVQHGQLCTAGPGEIAARAVDLMSYTGVSVFAIVNGTGNCSAYATIDGSSQVIADETNSADIVDFGFISPGSSAALALTSGPDNSGTCCLDLIGVSGEEI